MKKKILAVLSSALLLGAIAAPSSQAATAGAGGVGFVGFAHLATFPCDPGPCSGSFDGNASGTASGVLNDVPWTVTFVNSTMTAGFSFREPAATCPATGTASGSFTIKDGTAVATLGTATGTATADGTFTWDRVGTVANVATRVNIRIKIGATTHTVPVTGRAVAAFAPVGVAHCDAPQPLRAAVAGVDLIPDALNP